MPRSTDCNISGAYTDDQRARRAEGPPPALIAYMNGPQSIHEKITGFGPSLSPNRVGDTKAELNDWDKKWKLLELEK